MHQLPYNIFHNSQPLQPSSYYLTCNGYSPNCAFYHCYYGQHPPPYSQPFFPPLFLPKRHLPLHVSQQPHIFSEPPSSIRRGQSSLRVQRHTSHLHTRTTTLKRRRTSTGQPPAFPISAALSSIQPTEDTHTHDWRSGYKPPSQSSYFRRHFESFLVPCNLTTAPSCILSPLRLNPLLVAVRADRPNIFYDLRKPQIVDAIFLPCLNRLPNTIDFYQLITSPPIHHMTLWHRKLPWQLHIEAHHPNGITLYDFFLQVHQQLHQFITQEEYDTDELAPGDREVLTMAFQMRCAMFPDPLLAGVRRIDFLGQEVCFIGLKPHSRGGRWQLKTQLPPPKQRMTID